MKDLQKEIEEEILRDKYRSFFKTYGSYIIVGFVLVLLGVGLTQYLNYKSTQSAYSVSDKYQDALKQYRDGKTDQALSSFQSLSVKTPKGYEALSQLISASILEQQEQLEKAIPFYQQAGKNFPEKILKDLSQLKAAYSASLVEDSKNVIETLNSLSKKGAPFEYLARELRASLNLKLKLYQEAKKDYGFLSISPKVPQSIKTRSERALSFINHIMDQSDNKTGSNKQKDPKSTI